MTFRKLTLTNHLFNVWLYLPVNTGIPDYILPFISNAPAVESNKLKSNLPHLAVKLVSIKASLGLQAKAAFLSLIAIMRKTVG